MFDGKAFGAEIVEAVKAYVGRATSALEARLDALEAWKSALPSPQPGRDGKDANPEDIRKAVAEAIAALPPAPPGPQGEPGKDGHNGRDADPEDTRQIVLAAMAALEPPPAGAPGPPGPSGPPGRDVDPTTVENLERAFAERNKALVAEVEMLKSQLSDVRKSIENLPPPREVVNVTGAVIDRNDSLVMTFSDGSQKDLGRVVGRDADEAKFKAYLDGEVAKIPAPRDAFGFDDMQLAFDGERTVIWRYERAGHVKEFPIVFPVVLDRGVWREGEYAKGDAVTWGGSLWIAQEPTIEKPETGAAWRLAVKRGRDGKGVDTTQKAPPGPIRAPVPSK